MTNELIATRLEEYSTVSSIRRAYKSLLPQNVFDGRRVLLKTVEKDIPCFSKFGPLLLRIFYPRQPKACWKCASPDHIGRECPSDFSFNSHHLGHQAHQCEERIGCSLCKSYHHLAIECPGNWGRHTLVQRTPQRQEPVDQDPPPPPIPKTSRIWITLMNPRKKKRKPPRILRRFSLMNNT